MSDVSPCHGVVDGPVQPAVTYSMGEQVTDATLDDLQHDS